MQLSSLIDIFFSCDINIDPQMIAVVLVKMENTFVYLFGTVRAYFEKKRNNPLLVRNDSLLKMILEKEQILRKFTI